MEYFKLLIILFACFVCLMTPAAVVVADTIVTSDGKEIKGIVVEDYKDRVVFSTADGEVMVMKSDMRELSLDSEEDNLIKLAEQASDHRDYSRGMRFYEMALKVNPDSSVAKQGMAYLQGNIFRKEESAKSAAIKRQQDIELYGDQVAVRTDPNGIVAVADTLEKTTGMKIAIVGNMPRVESVKSRSPASEAGLMKGDLLVSVWGKLTGYLSLKEILNLLVHKSAIEIRCVIERDINTAINPDKTLIASPEDLIGASLAMEIDGLTISDVKEGSSAIASGLRKDDLIMSIDGSQTRYMPLKKAVELIRSSSRPSVKLTIRRKVIIWRRSEL